MSHRTYHGYKPFQKKLYLESDKKAKQVVSSFLESTGRFILDTPIEQQKESFSTRDFEIRHIPTQKLISVEAEQKLVWTEEGKWQSWFSSGVDIPYRKIKSKADLFVMINKSGNTLLTIPMKVVKNSELIHKDTKIKGSNTKTKQEPFFRVSLSHEKLRMYHKKNGTWSRLS